MGRSSKAHVITAADPAYVHQLDESLHQIGRTRNDVRALALTHGHIDRTGMAAALAESGATIYLHPADSRLAARPRSNTTQRSLLQYAYYPAVIAFLAHVIRHGALRPRPCRTRPRSPTAACWRYRAIRR